MKRAGVAPIPKSKMATANIPAMRPVIREFVGVPTLETGESLVAFSASVCPIRGLIDTRGWFCAVETCFALCRFGFARLTTWGRTAVGVDVCVTLGVGGV